MSKESIESRGQRARIVPAYIRIPIIVLCIGSALFFVFTETGPAKWINDLQLSIFEDYYYGMLTLLLTMLITLLPGVIIVRLLIPVFEKAEDNKPKPSDEELLDN